MLSGLYLPEPISRHRFLSNDLFSHSPSWVVVRSPSTHALGQVVDDHTGSGVGSEGDRGTVEQARALTGGADGERFAFFVRWEFAHFVAFLDRFDALDAIECR